MHLHLEVSLNTPMKMILILKGAEKLITELGWVWETDGYEYDQINFDKQKFEEDWNDCYWGIA